MKNFLQAPASPRGFLSFLLPLFAIFVGLGSSNSAYAQISQSTATIRNVRVTAGTAPNPNTSDYDAIPATGGTGIGGGIFANTNFGNLDFSTGQLLLQGGTIEIQEANGETFNTARVDFGVGPTGSNPSFANTINLVQTGFNAATSTRTFSLTTAGRDILANAAVTGAGTYRFDIRVSADGEDTSGDGVFIFGVRRSSTFTTTGVRAAATVQANTIAISPNGNTDVTYYFNSATTPQFPGANLSDPNNGGTSYDVNNGQLLLNNTTVTTTEAGSSTINNVVLYYRTRLSGTTGGAYSTITLTQSSGGTAGTKTFVLSPASGAQQPNLIATPAVTAAGTYFVDVYYQANGTNGGNSFSITDPPTANGAYSASFTVSGIPIAQTIWTGALNDNWFDAANWTNGVPNANTNALIRDLGAGSTSAYPNIYANTVRTTAAGDVLYNNATSGPAVTRNLIMGGTSQATRSIARLIVGRLIVYGDFGNVYDSFIQRENTVIEFAGDASNGSGGNQSITSGTFVAVEISGTGRKTLAGIASVAQSITFSGGILATDITSPNTSAVVLAGRAPVNNNDGAQLIGETDASYLFGFARTTRENVVVGETRTYGNMGLTITFNGVNNPGNVDVTRNTVEAYSPVNGRFGIRRIFGVRPADQATNSGGLLATFMFRYLDSETQNLNGPNTRTPGNGSIDENNLLLFVSTTGGNTFSPLGRDVPVDVVNNIVTTSGIRTFATFTLGDETRPLPVELISFDAKREATNAQLTWSTASEKNNLGFEVQVSTDGQTFRKIGFVASESLNSSRQRKYSFVDAEKGKSGTRYYRLRQNDADGKFEFSPVRVVNFGTGTATQTQPMALTAYPNPFVDGDKMVVAVQTLTAGTAQMQITDVLGREVSKQSFQAIEGLQEVAVPVAQLTKGIYMAKVTLASGEVKTIRIQKQ